MKSKSKKLKIAIIGSGISGLTSAFLLSKKHEVFLYEKNDYIGGHTHTHEIYENDKKINVDSGFIVYNENTYPNFMKLLDILKIESQHTTMGFSVKSDSNDFEYAGNSIHSIFAQKSNIFRPSFLKMIYQILRFNKISKNEYNNIDENVTLNDYLLKFSFSEKFVNHYIIPMGAAIWSTSPKKMLNMPAKFFIRFFQNHGLLKVINRPQWWVIKNGSKQYVKKIIKPFENNIVLNCKINSISRSNEKVTIKFDKSEKIFDAVVIATHSDQALELLSDSTDAENQILGSIKYQKNSALIHTDKSILPKRKIAWSSWNYLLNESSDNLVTLTYNMNILQTLKSKKVYCVTLNNTTSIDESKIIKKIIYHHPLFDLESVKAQNQKNKICGSNNTYFCGAYWGYGFHEDGVNSALDVCKKFGIEF
ncbi:MAG: FAD-dependent oxidoreductase [Candidatus Marinimicrobia bacterium]|nr:FAD-dependent oxidoreductase [Candidatus Neomarinimicrobiota bacterium]|tara:strand:- start:3622 stop:4884 length:1263 start_codon:yes stop_codon:yes gene_type:complete